MKLDFTLYLHRNVEGELRHPHCAARVRSTLLSEHGEDEFGEAVHREPERFIPNHAGFARQWSAARSAYALFAVRDFDRLHAELGLPMEIVARGPRYIVVRKP